MMEDRRRAGAARTTRRRDDGHALVRPTASRRRRTRGRSARSGEPYFVHAMTVASILADLRLDVDTLIAALVHDVVEDTGLRAGRTSGSASARTSPAWSTASPRSAASAAVSPEARKAETYRKLVLAIAQDPRTVLIKLADRLHNMRTIEFLDADAPARHRPGDDGRLRAAGPPLRHRAGSSGSWRTCAFKVLQPERYFEIEARHQPDARRARAPDRGGCVAPLADALRRRGVPVPRSPAGPSTSTRSTAR